MNMDRDTVKIIAVLCALFLAVAIPTSIIVLLMQDQATPEEPPIEPIEPHYSPNSLIPIPEQPYEFLVSSSFHNPQWLNLCGFQ